MATIKPSYAAAATMVLTASGLATTAGLLVGRQSTAIDNTTDLADDALVGGKIVSIISSTVNTQIQLWAFGSYDGTTYTASAGATDAAFTPDTGAKNLMKLLTVIPNITTTAGTTYAWGPVSIAQAFGGTMPRNWGVYVVHNTGVNLGVGCELKYTAVQYTSV